MKLGSKDNSERKAAKDSLKHKYLEEFKAHDDYSKEDLKELNAAVKMINRRLLAPKQADGEE